MKYIPPLVALLVQYHSAWIVGSAANPENNNPRDYDVVVPFACWSKAAALIPKDATVNTYGGWKCKVSDNGNVYEVDIWPEDMEKMLSSAYSEWIWNPKLKIHWKKQ
jgi:hypothetical protein